MWSNARGTATVPSPGPIRYEQIDDEVFDYFAGGEAHEDDGRAPVEDER
jgi:hypothetical protein